MSTVFQHAKLADVQNFAYPGAQMAFLIGFTFQTSINPLFSWRFQISRCKNINNK